MHTAKLRLANRTDTALEIDAETHRRFGGVYTLMAEVMEELLDRRAAMGYVAPVSEPAEAEATPKTPRRATIDSFLDAHAEPAQEETDATV